MTEVHKKELSAGGFKRNGMGRVVWERSRIAGKTKWRLIRQKEMRRDMRWEEKKKGSSFSFCVFMTDADERRKQRRHFLWTFQGMTLDMRNEIRGLNIRPQAGALLHSVIQFLLLISSDKSSSSPSFPLPYVMSKKEIKFGANLHSVLLSSVPTVVLIIVTRIYRQISWDDSSCPFPCSSWFLM